MQQRTTVLTQKRSPIDIQNQISLLIGKRDRTNQRRRIAAGQRNWTLASDVRAAAMTRNASVKGLSVAGRTNLHGGSDLPLQGEPVPAQAGMRLRRRGGRLREAPSYIARDRGA